MGFGLSDILPDSVRKQVLTAITPNQEEIDLQTRIINQLSEALRKMADTIDFHYSFISAEGSTGRKQTQLKGAADIDLFVGLNPEDYPKIFTNDQSVDRKVIDIIMSSLISKWFEPAVKSLEVTNVQRAFSQHPFLSLKMEGIDIDILGCFDIDSETLAEKGPITAVDRTVHHTSFVADRITQTKREDARILKSFVRACHAYGDTCAVGRMGLTGVTLELLVLSEPNLKSAISALRNLDSEPVDPQNRSLEQLKKVPSFRDDLLFLIDPTDYSRNMASSFSTRSFRWVQYKIDRLRDVLKTGDDQNAINSLLESPIPSSNLPEWIEKHAIVREFLSNGKIHYTILRDKLHRLARKAITEMSSERTGEPRFEDILAEVYFKDNRYAMGMLVERPSISDTYDRKGPPIALKDAVVKFKEAHSDDVFELDEFLYIREKREWTSPLKLFDNIVENNPIDGLEIQTDTTKLSNQVLHVLYDYILPIEPEFKERITRVKDEEKNQSM
jgi:tRNA nucleotidyltransferase (CCA-adding enzyme)